MAAGLPRWIIRFRYSGAEVASWDQRWWLRSLQKSARPHRA